MIRKISSYLFEILLIILLLLGVSYRLRWVAWNQKTNLHPDEYGLTNTLTQLSLPKNLADYFNTRLSPLSPYMRYDAAGQPAGDGADNRMRWGQWPIIMIRFAGELSGQTGYDEIRLLGRRLSGWADILSVLLLFLIGQRLYGRRVGLLAAALSSLAVMQIQQSHFMTVDNFGMLFIMAGLYACVRIAQQPCAVRDPQENYTFERQTLLWSVLFGVALGMAVASKINLLPLGGMILAALFLSIADLKLKSSRDLPRILIIAAACLAVSVLAAGATFRLTQPMTFRALSGDTTLFTLTPNPDWLASMQLAQNESSGVGGGPPGEQWAHRTVILFPLMNIVLWGMGIALGVTAWIGVLAASWRLARLTEWRAHLLPLLWTGGYFIFMGTRWVKSIRYFLPIYPFLCLFAAWLLLELWRRAGERRPARLGAAAAISLVLIATLAWANAFTAAVYQVDHTRIQATRWMFANIPAPFHLTLQGENGNVSIPISAPDNLKIGRSNPFSQVFRAPQNGTLLSVTIPHAAASGGTGRLSLAILPGNGSEPLSEASLDIPAGAAPGSEVRAELQNAALKAGGAYTLRVTALDAAPVTIWRTVVANESWDEGLPFPFDGYNPFGQLYRGLEMEVRWYDTEEKRQMFLANLAQVDYIILPSQRGIWTTCRLPDMYPLTMTYYRALFNGQLGFERVATFSAPLRIGPLQVSDVAGSLAWNQTPSLPIFNSNPLAAEEAFSVYDHPPVWIFKKRADFNLQAAADLLNAVDLNRVQIQSPHDATGAPCQE